MTATAGRLVWDLDVNKQEEALAKVDALGKKLDEALNKGRGANTGLAKVGTDATEAANRVTTFARQFTQLNVQMKTGQVSASQYATASKRLLGDLNGLARATDLTVAEYRALNSLIPQVSRAQATLGGSTAQVNARVQTLVNEVRILRNEWQRTGTATDATKARLNALQVEMKELSDELRATDAGFERYNAQIARLAVGGRSAEATVAGIEGRMSRLGLATQVSLATQQAMTSQFYRYGPAGQIAGSALGIVGSNMGALSVGSVAAAGGVLAVGAAAVSLTRRGIPEVREFQSAFRVLVASGLELSEAELDEELSRIQEAAGRAGGQFRRAEMATALAELVKAGLEAADALDLLVPGMQLSAITGDSLNDTTTRLLANLRQFGLDTRDAARAADVLATADLAAANGAKELSEGLAVVGPVANAAGFALEDVLGILVELDNKGLNPADVGATALRGTLSALLDPTKEARGVLAGLGVELENADGSSRPLLTVLRELQKAFEGNEEAAQAAAQIFDTRAITAILNMTDVSEELTRSLLSSAGAAQEYADKLLDENFAAAQEDLANATADLAKSFAGTFADDIAGAARQLAEFFRQVDRLKDQGTLERVRFFTQLFLPNAQTVVEDMNLFGGLPPVPERPSGPFVFDGQQFGPQGAPAGFVPPPAPSPALAELIAQARTLRAELDAATDEQAWVEANRAVDAFRDSSELAAEAWAAVNATLSGRTSSTSGSTSGGRPPRTIKDVLDDLTKAESDATRIALAFGESMDARIASAQARGTAVKRALDDLLVDFGLDPLSAEVQFLVGRLTQLEGEIEAMQSRLLRPTLSPSQRTAMQLAEAGGASDGIRTGMTPQQIRDALLASPAFKIAQEEAAAAWREYGRAIRKAATVAERYDGQEILGPTAGMRGGLTTTEIRALLKDALDRALQAYLDTVTSPFRQTAMVLAEVGGPGGGMAGGLTQDEVLEALRGSPAHTQNVREAELAWRDYVNTVQGWAEFADERLGAEIGGPSGGMSTGMTPGEIRAALEAAVQRRWEEFQAEMTRPTRQTAMQLAEVDGPSAGMATGMSWEDIRASLQGALPTVEKLQRQLISLRSQGFDANSDAIRRLVRQINELQLAAARDELSAKGFAGLSDFNKQVLIANGILPGATVQARSFSDALRTLAGNDVADGLADIIDGIKQIRDAGDDAEGVVQGLTLALNGATKIVESLSSGDAFGTVKNLAMLAGEGIGQLLKIPGLGQAVGGALDLGRSIVQAISDAFTGDSPAARAIRESLTPAVTTAFSSGILAALRGESGWREGLEDGVKTAFVGALVQAFVQSAIVGAILQPIITQFSKLIAQGQYDEATAFLRTELPAALDAALRGVDAFVAGFPPGLLTPTGGTGGSQAALPGQSPATYHSLPVAQVASGPPSWAVDIMSAGASIRQGGADILQAAQLLTSQGVTVKQSRSGSGGAAAARAA